MKCANPKCSKDNATKNCPCKTASYCDQNCQKQHWAEHNKAAMHVLFYAAETNDAACKKRLALIPKGIFPINKENNAGKPALLIASEKGHLEVVNILISLGASVDAPDNEGVAPLYAAAKGNHLEVARALLQAKALVNTVDEKQRCPLAYAAEAGAISIVKLLLENRALIEITDKYQDTPLNLAIQNQQVETARLLIQAKANIESADNVGDTPLILAAERGITELVSLLIQHQADVNQVDEFGMSPLHFAVDNQHIAVSRQLLASRADVLSYNKDYSTPLSIALYSRNFELLQLLDEAKLAQQNRDPELFQQQISARRELYFQAMEKQSAIARTEKIEKEAISFSKTYFFKRLFLQFKENTLVAKKLRVAEEQVLAQKMQQAQEFASRYSLRMPFLKLKKHALHEVRTRLEKQRKEASLQQAELEKIKQAEEFTQAYPVKTAFLKLKKYTQQKKESRLQEYRLAIAALEKERIYTKDRLQLLEALNAMEREENLAISRREQEAANRAQDAKWKQMSASFWAKHALKRGFLSFQQNNFEKKEKQARVGITESFMARQSQKRGLFSFKTHLLTKRDCIAASFGFKPSAATRNTIDFLEPFIAMVENQDIELYIYGSALTYSLYNIEAMPADVDVQMNILRNEEAVFTLIQKMGLQHTKSSGNYIQYQYRGPLLPVPLDITLHLPRHEVLPSFEPIMLGRLRLKILNHEAWKLQLMNSNASDLDTPMNLKQLIDKTNEGCFSIDLSMNPLNLRGFLSRVIKKFILWSKTFPQAPLSQELQQFFSVEYQVKYFSFLLNDLYIKKTPLLSSNAYLEMAQLIKDHRLRLKEPFIVQIIKSFFAALYNVNIQATQGCEIVLMNYLLQLRSRGNKDSILTALQLSMEYLQNHDLIQPTPFSSLILSPERIFSTAPTLR